MSSCHHVIIILVHVSYMLGFAAPGIDTQGVCQYGKGKYLRCSSHHPDRGYRRACVCQQRTAS